jgi:hypothetical protein
MKNTIQLISIILVMLLFSSCGPSQRELAVQKINMAKQQISNGDTIRAIEMLDSLKYQYPKAEMQAGIAKNMTNELYRQLIDQRTQQLIENDSLIITLETKFNKEKTEYDRYMQYNHKRQSSNRTWKRSFLQVHLDERGSLYLSSNYMGKEWLKHTGIRVYDGNLQSKSDTISLDDPLNHRSDFLDYKWEKVTYMNGKADSVIHFIAENPNLNLKCVFLGSRYYYILLEDYDIQAVIDALALSKAIKQREALREEIKKLTNQH